MALDPQTHRLYLSAATLQKTPESAPATGHRPATVPGTFKVLVYGQ